MSTLNLIWDNITPLPDCGYRIDYRRIGEQVDYSQWQTSGSTSDTTSIGINIDAPANYEGAIYADCCSGSTSEGDPFAVNAYVELQVLLNISGSTFSGRLFSDFPNPYDTLVTVTIHYHIGASYDVYTNTSTYPAGTILRNAFSAVVPGIVVDSYGITAIAPVFDNGGTLQQFDPLSTPSYFKFYADSIPETSGSPAAQPSFILNSFVVTEVDSSNNPTAGNLLVKWGQQSVFADGVTPYDNFTFKVRDENNALLGELTVDATVKGLREASIPLTKVLIPLDTSHEYSMSVYWDNGALIGTAKLFYLPDF